MTTVSSRWCHRIQLSDIGENMDAVISNLFQQCLTSAKDLSLLLSMLAGDTTTGAFPIKLVLE